MKTRKFFLGNAFSLIELLLVVILIGVLAGLSLPRFSQSYSQIRLEQTAYNLASMMRYAQGRALSRQEEIQLQFDSDFTRYHLMERKGDNFEVIEGRRGRAQLIPKGISIESEETTVGFSPGGAMDKVRIYLSNEKGKIFTVTTRELRGSVKVFDSEI
ncbi:MAG: prepilin-type N-terminal cleavage/methylation domain-containing protein [Candidatus Aceula meridiana]|nr:prepilin-type N-terminal cleavage/methylation domain-containing protein [Candidatus Aceula meridiana]